jgi:hypothetical protein
MDDTQLRRNPAADAAASPDAALEERIRRIERFAEIMDMRFRIPVIGWPLGVDGLLGLIPGVGDTAVALASLWLLNEARELGARPATLAKMALNVGVDWALGLVPLAGDLLDIAHKANAKNARLLAADLRDRGVDVRVRFGPELPAVSDLLSRRRG